MKTQSKESRRNGRRILQVGPFFRLLPMLLSPRIALAALVWTLLVVATAAVLAPPAEASPVTPVPEQPLLAEQTPYEACLARAPDPEVCKGVPNSTPSSGGSQEDSPQYSPGGPTPRQMAAAKAAVQEAVKDRGGAVDGATAYAAALAAARRAGADEQGASVAAAQAVAELSPSSYEVPKDEPANTAGSPSDVPSAGGESPSAEQTTFSVAGGEASTRASTEAPAQASAAVAGGATAPTAAAEDGSGSLKASVGSLGSASPLVLGAAGLLLLLAAAGLGGVLIRRGRRVS